MDLKPSKLTVSILAWGTLCLWVSSCTPQRESYEYRPVITITPLPLPPACPPQPVEHLNLTTPLTLQEAIDIALESNPDIEQTLARMRQAEATIGEVNAAFLPIITTTTSFLHADAPSAYFFKHIDARILNPNTNFNYPGTFSNYETDVTIQYNIYNAGISLLNRWKAEKGQSLKCIDHLTLKNALTASVIDAYQSCLALQAAEEIIKASERTVAKQVALARQRYEEGALMRSDLLFLEVRQAEAIEEVINAEHAVKLALASLANLLGGDADSSISIVPEDNEWIPMPQDYESALALALSIRPELLAARKNVEIAAIDVDMVKREFLPKVDALGKVYWDSPHMTYSGNRTNWETGVGVSWSMYEGGRRCYALCKAKEILNEMLIQDRKRTLSVQLDIKQAYLSLESAQARIATADKTVEHAAENLRMIRERYDEGAVSVTDYLDAEVMDTKSRMRKTQAICDLRKAQASVAMSVGLFSVSECVK